MLIAWLAVDHAIVILVARHDRTANDVYGQLLEALEVGVPNEEGDKPPCCDESGESPADEHVALVIADAVERGQRRGRRLAR